MDNHIIELELQASPLHRVNLYEYTLTAKTEVQSMNRRLTQPSSSPCGGPLSLLKQR